MKLFKHSNYELYRHAQVEANLHKFKQVWVKGCELEYVANHITHNIKPLKFGVCHGARNGFEVNLLRNLLDIDVIGTDIAPTAHQCEHMIEWDFHDVKPEWIEAFDFIYSNSLDHSYNPALCLARWQSCLRKGGICYVHHYGNRGNKHKVTSVDCFRGPWQEYRQLLQEVFPVVNVVFIPCKKKSSSLSRPLLVARNDSRITLI